MPMVVTSLQIPDLFSKYGHYNGQCTLFVEVINFSQVHELTLYQVVVFYVLQSMPSSCRGILLPL